MKSHQIYVQPDAPKTPPRNPHYKEKAPSISIFVDNRTDKREKFHSLQKPIKKSQSVEPVKENRCDDDSPHCGQIMMRLAGCFVR